MEDYKKRLIEEHSQLVIRIEKLHNWVYSDQSNVDNKVEFANKCVQLAAMKKYEEALYARLTNVGIFCEEGVYFEKVASIECEEKSCDNKNNDNDSDRIVCNVTTTNDVKLK